MYELLEEIDRLPQRADGFQAPRLYLGTTNKMLERYIIRDLGFTGNRIIYNNITCYEITLIHTASIYISLLHKPFRDVLHFTNREFLLKWGGIEQ